LSRSRVDQVLGTGLGVAGGLATLLVAAIALFLMRESWAVFQTVGLRRFITDTSWSPTEKLYGLAPMLLASVLTGVGAVIIAAPLGVGSALFSRFYVNRQTARVQRAIVTLMSGIPSVVFGLWGLVVLVPMIGKFMPPGTSLLAAMLVLALMILPTVALTADAALGTVPSSLHQGAAALGLSREATILHVLLPAARTGIVAGVLLSLGRALGETMAVLMVAGNVVQVPANLFEPVRTLTANVALEMAYAVGDHRASLFVSGLALTIAVGALAIASWRMTEGRSRA
jgi:phosphate transport system permease protein